MNRTNEQFDTVVAKCRSIFLNKMKDYGASWRILRPQSVTDQLFIKAKRIRSIEVKGNAKIEDSVFSEFMAIVNYGVIGLIQLEQGYTCAPDIDIEEAMHYYDQKIALARSLMLDKNHDYDEAWREMRISSYTDLILTKLNRIKEIEDNNGLTLSSEGIGSNYLDIMNYAVFGLIRLEFPE